MDTFNSVKAKDSAESNKSTTSTKSVVSTQSVKSHKSVKSVKSTNSTKSVVSMKSGKSVKSVISAKSNESTKTEECTEIAESRNPDFYKLWTIDESEEDYEQKEDLCSLNLQNYLWDSLVDVGVSPSPLFHRIFPETVYEQPDGAEELQPLHGIISFKDEDILSPSENDTYRCLQPGEKIVRVHIEEIYKLKLKKDFHHIKIEVLFKNEVVRELEGIEYNKEKKKPTKIDCVTIFQWDTTKPNILDDIVANPILFIIYESNQSVKSLMASTTKSAGSLYHPIGSCCLDLLPLVQGEVWHKEKIYVHLDQYVQGKNQNIDVTSEQDRPFLNVNVTCNDVLVPPEILANSNLLCFTLESIFNPLPKMLWELFHSFTAGIRIPIWSQEFQEIYFRGGTILRVGQEKRKPKRWYDLKKVEGETTHTKYRREYEVMSRQNQMPVLPKLEEIHPERLCIDWNKMRRVLLTSAGKNAFYNHIKRGRKLPIEFEIKTFSSNKVKSKHVLHLVAYVDLSSLLYPGETCLRTTAQVYTFCHRDFERQSGLSPGMFAREVTKLEEQKWNEYVTKKQIQIKRRKIKYRAVEEVEYEEEEEEEEEEERELVNELRRFPRRITNKDKHDNGNGRRTRNGSKRTSVISTNENKSKRTSRRSKDGNDSRRTSIISNGGNEIKRTSRRSRNGKDSRRTSVISNDGNESKRTSRRSTNGKDSRRTSVISNEGNDSKENSQSSKSGSDSRSSSVISNDGSESKMSSRRSKNENESRGPSTISKHGNGSKRTSRRSEHGNDSKRNSRGSKNRNSSRMTSLRSKSRQKTEDKKNRSVNKETPHTDRRSKRSTQTKQDSVSKRIRSSSWGFLEYYGVSIPLGNEDNEGVFVVVDVQLQKPLVPAISKTVLQERVDKLIPRYEVQKFEECHFDEGRYKDLDMKRFEALVYDEMRLIVQKIKQHFNSLNVPSTVLGITARFGSIPDRIVHDCDENCHFSSWLKDVYFLHTVDDGIFQELQNLLRLYDIIIQPRRFESQKDLQCCVSKAIENAKMIANRVLNSAACYLPVFDKYYAAKHPNETWLFFAEEAVEEKYIERANRYHADRLFSNLDDKNIWLDYVIFCIAKKDELVAELCLKHLLEMDHKDRLGMIIYALMLTEKKKYADAETIFRALTNYHPHLVEAWYIFHLFFIHTKRSGEAEAVLHKARRVLDCKIQCETLMSYDYSILRRDSLSFQPVSNPRRSIFIRVANILLKIRMYTFAELALQEAMRRGGGHFKYLYGMAIIRYQEMKYVDAIKLLKNASRLERKKSYAVHSLMAHTYYKMHYLQHALVESLTACECKRIPDDVHLLLYRKCVILLERKRHGYAIPDLLYLCQKRPTPNTWMRLGAAYLETGQVTRAEKALNESTQLDFACSLPWAYLAMANLYKGKWHIFEQCFCQMLRYPFEDVYEEVEEMVKKIEELAKSLQVENSDVPQLEYMNLFTLARNNHKRDEIQ